MELLHKRRGVSPVIEALLTVAIAIGGGALFYGFYSGLLGTSSQQPAVTVQQTSLSIGTSGTVFAITVKNSGTTSFTSSTMTIVLSGLPTVGTTTAPSTTSAGSITWSAATPAATDTKYTFTAAGSLAIAATTGFTAYFSLPSLAIGDSYPLQIVIGSVTLSTIVQAVQG